MSNKEELDFYKISSLILDVGRKALAERIKLDCINKKVSFEDLLNDAINKDKLLHLWQPMRCCDTKCSSTGKKSILYDDQWRQLYCQNSIAGHIKRNATGRICQSCIHVYSAVNSVTPDGFDITLCSCLLLNICVLSPLEIESVKKLRGLRNSVFAHAKEAKISVIDFNKHWNDIEAEILSISSNCCTSVQNGINTKIRDIKQLPYIDHEVYRTLFNKVLSSYDIVEIITESLDVQTAAINTNTPQYKVQKITEAEVCQTTFFIPTRGMKKGIDSLEKNGVVIFIGKCGSGKTQNSLEILRQVTEGNILPNHKVQHISIENWDSQIYIDEESVVFLEDPLGTTNANDALIKQDQGIFRKVFASVCAGKVKVILTIRSNIYQQHRNHLERHEIFQDTFIVDLSYGENALSESEKREFISQQCKFWSVEIVRNDEDIETERDQTMPMKLSQSTIQHIVNSDPPIGYPLCCKQFFQDRKNLALGKRFFCQPTSILLDEMRDMILSENEDERRDIGLLIYMVMSGGKCDPNNIDNGKMGIIAEALCIHSYANIHVRISLNKLKNKHVDFSIKCQQYEFSHISVLESVFFSCCSQIPNLIPDMLMNIDIKVLCEFIRTANDNVRENETVYVIPEIYFQDLAKRFMTEINSMNFIGFVSHLSLFDDKFVKIFINMLKDTNYSKLVNDENSSVETFFDVICLFDNSKLTSAVLDARLIPEGMIRHGALICIEFDNINTMKVLIPKMSFEQIRFAFTSAYKKMKMAMVQLLFDEGKDDLRKQDLIQGFICICGTGNGELIDQFIAFGIEDGLDKGFNEACKRDNISVVRMLMEKSNIRMTIDPVPGFVHACERKNIEIVEYLLTRFSPTEVRRAVIKACNKYNRHMISKILQNRSVTDEQVNHLLNDYRKQNDCDWNIVCMIIKERKDLTAEHVYQCLREYCSHKVCNGDNVYKIIQERKDLTAEHVYQCLREYCTHRHWDRDNAYKIIQERKDLTSEHVYQYLREYCTHRHWNRDHVYEIIQERKDLTTEHVYQYLREYCTHKECDGDNVYKIIQERKDLTTAHVYQCLKEYCSHKECDRFKVFKIIRERKDLTTEHVYQCLKEYYSHHKYSAHNRLYEIIQGRKDLKIEQVQHCFLHCHLDDGYDSYLINEVLLGPDVINEVLLGPDDLSDD